MTRPPSLVRSIAQIVAVGLLAALAVGSAGHFLMRARLGTSDAEAIQRIELELTRRFLDTSDALAERTARLIGLPQSIVAAVAEPASARTLFEILSVNLAPDPTGQAGLTVYAANGAPVAWAGRVTDLPRDRIDDGNSQFVALDALGPRLVRVDAMTDPARPSTRLATVVAEELVAQRTDVASFKSDTFRVATSVAEVSVHATPGLAPSAPPYGFAIRDRTGAVLAQAEVDPAALEAARTRWSEYTRSAVLLVLSLTVLFAAAPFLEWRRHAVEPGAFLVATGGLIGLLLGGRALLELADGSIESMLQLTGIRILPNALLLAALMWLAIDAMERRRLSRPHVPLVTQPTRIWTLTIVGFLIAGAAAAALLLRYQRMLAGIATQESQDLVRFALHPFDAGRIGLVAAFIFLHAAVVWGSAGLLRLPTVLWRSVRSPIQTAAAVVSALAGAALVIGLSRSLTLPPLAFWAPFGAAGLAAALLARPRGTTRRASQAARLALFFLALVLPAVAFYPALDAFAVQSKERVVVEELAPVVGSQREAIQHRLAQALDAIDAMPTLAEFVTSSGEDAAPTTDRAFIIWSQTELAASRTTSAVELHSAGGRLVSRFALDLPEYAPAEYRGGACSRWELFEEVSPIGSSISNALRASRAICVDGRRVGGIVVRARLDYRALPFVNSQNPYLESLLPRHDPAAEASYGSDVELVTYGWSRAPLYASGSRVWTLDDDVFGRMTQSRDGLWKRVARDTEGFRVYFFNDRGGIYALGYPVATWVDHTINLAELTFFCGVLYLLLLTGATVFNALTGQTPASGRALLREIRSSFYRKLFIAFVGAAAVPVIVLALTARTYLANQSRAGVEESAIKTATVAQRLVEDYIALQQGGTGSLDRIDDEFMLTVRRAIDEDVNLFDGPRLRATSERPLFVSRLLSVRTPAEIYRDIALERLPTTVVVEELGAEGGYLVAAAPVRAGTTDGIITVPQTLKQREIERQIDELDRRVLSAAVLFVLLGSALGYWMAERIADPVNRLTRATRRIARGDLDARIAATSSDELRRLVQDFNQMADDLKLQRANLERTQRLEAWAEMARQVAHDIKNPLTPIQLSAEHAQRINVDRGRPLSPALDECMSAILSQVRLLRQISSEFSSFASSPTANPEPASVSELVEEVIEPYRRGLLTKVTLDVDAPTDLPYAMVDRTLLGRALTNVVENALHAMPGGGALSLRVFHAAASAGSPAGSDGWIVLAVTDTGVGMDQQALARIFEPYFSTKATGTGLGLTIARRNIELLHGSIEVQSERGVGTTVTMRVPVANRQ